MPSVSNPCAHLVDKDPLTPNPSPQVAYHTLSILLGLVYCIIQPVIAPLVLSYCLISLFIAKCALPLYQPTFHSQRALL